MADYCFRCLIDDGVPEYAPRNDFVGCEGWHLCEGCGPHWFDVDGKRHCSAQSWYENPEQDFMSACQQCLEAHA